MTAVHLRPALLTQLGPFRQAPQFQYFAAAWVPESTITRLCDMTLGHGGPRLSQQGAGARFQEQLPALFALPSTVYNYCMNPASLYRPSYGMLHTPDAVVFPDPTLVPIDQVCCFDFSRTTSPVNTYICTNSSTQLSWCRRRVARLAHIDLVRQPRRKHTPTRQLALPRYLDIMPKCLSV